MIKLGGLTFLFSLSLILSYSCTEKTPCNKGFQLLSLIRSHLDKGTYKCITSKEQLENIIEEMGFLECGQCDNETLKLYYARYLCSQYDIQHGFNEVKDIESDAKKDVDVTSSDNATKNYLKGLDLYGQIVFSPKRTVDTRCKEFINFLRRLKIDNKSLKIYDDAIICLFDFANIDIEKRCSQIKDIELRKYIIKKINIGMQNEKYNFYVLKAMFSKVRQLNNENINDGFFMYYSDKFKEHEVMNHVTDCVEKIHKKGMPLSDGMKFIYSFALAKKHTTKRINSSEQAQYLKSRIKTRVPFKTEAIKTLFYGKTGMIYARLGKNEKAVSYFEHILSYKYDRDLMYGLYKTYIRLNNFEKALKYLEGLKADYRITHNKKILQELKEDRLFLLKELGREEEYDALLLAHNKEVMEDRMKQNKKYAAAAKKYLELKALEEKACLQREVALEAARLKNISVPNGTAVKKETEEDSFTDQKVENLKKEYKEVSKGKEKTRGVANPIEVVEEIVPEIIEKPSIRIEELISGTASKTFEKLFGPYEKNPIMDSKITIHPDDIKNLMKALEFPYSFSGGKGDHTKGTLIFEDDDKTIKEYMIIIPYRVPGIHPHYIKSLRDIFTSMNLYPHYLEESLSKAGLLNKK